MTKGILSMGQLDIFTLTQTDSVKEAILMAALMATMMCAAGMPDLAFQPYLRIN